jgi:ferredoxin-NADP reductase/CRP-like cAMP-binding protein
MDIEFSTIKNNPYFCELNEDELSLIQQQTVILTLSTNTVLFHEGDPADAFYIVKNGAIQIYTVNTNKAPIILSRVAPEGFFGEQVFSVSPSPRRQASAKAQMDTVLYKIPRAAILELRQGDQRFQAFLQKQTQAQILEKLNKIAASIEQSSINLIPPNQNIISFPKRSIIFSSDLGSKNIYILVSGEVELRSMDSEKKVTQLITIYPGHFFEAGQGYTAIAKQDTSVVALDENPHADLSTNMTFLNQLRTHAKSKIIFNTKAKISQFRSEYMEMPTTTTIIALREKKEIICQQIMGAEFFLVSVNYLQVTRKITYHKDENYSRELHLAGNQLIGLLDQGGWEDSYKFLDFIIEEKQLNENQLQIFSETGNIADVAVDAMNEKIICQCLQISLSEIKKLITTRQADFDLISQQTGASTICGSCRPAIQELLGNTVWVPHSIAKVIEYTPHIRAFQFKALNQTLSRPKPGQYLTMKAKIDNIWVQRNYTLTSTPDQSELEIIVKKEPQGLLSAWLFNQTTADLIVYLAGPYGNFTLETTENKPVVCIVGGIGVTPAIAFARYLAKINSQQYIHVDYTTTTKEQAIAVEEFLKITKAHHTISFHHRITNSSGHITEQELQNLFSAKKDCRFFLCAPRKFEQFAIEFYKKMGLDPDKLHVEEFIHSGAPGNITQTISFE